MATENHTPFGPGPGDGRSRVGRSARGVGRGAAAVVAQGAGPLNQARFGMTSAEALVLGLALVLIIAVLAFEGTLTSRASMLLSALALLAVVVVLLHRWLG